MTVVLDYRGHRIEVNAVAADGRWNADVRIHPVLAEEKAHVETLTQLWLSPELAEASAEAWARLWVDVQAL